MMNTKGIVLDGQHTVRDVGWFAEINRLEDGIRTIGATASAFWRRGVGSSNKQNHHDIVTEADTALEVDLRHLINTLYPGAKVLGEESGGDELGDAFWVIDPIDGTSEFMRGGRNWCMAIGLIERGHFDFSMIYVPFGTEGPELYYGKRDQGAYVDAVWKRKKRTRALRVTNKDDLGKAALAIHQEDLWNSDLAITTLSKQCRGTNILGSTSYMLASLAAGRFDIVITRLQKRTWDLIGLLLVEEAGGKITRIDGTEPFDFRSGKDAENDFLATNSLLHEQAMRVITSV